MAEKNSKKQPATEFPWLRQPGEGIKPYEAFNTYMLMGTERSQAKVSNELGKSTALLSKWSVQWNWVERATAWDVEQERLARLDQMEAIRKMRKRHAVIASSMIAKAAKRMEQMQPEELTPQDVKAFVDVASKLERISRGDVGEVVEERDGGAAINPVQIYIPDNGRDDIEDDE